MRVKKCRKLRIYDEHGNKYEVYERKHLLDDGKDILINGEKYESYDHIFDDGKKIIRPDASSYDVYSTKHLLDDGMTVRADGKTYDVYSGTGIFGEQYTKVDQRDFYGNSAGSSSGGYTGSSGASYGGYGGGASYGGYEDFTIPTGSFYGAVSIPQEKIRVFREILVLPVLPAMAVLAGGFGTDAFLFLFAIFLVTWAGIVLSGLHNGLCEFLPAMGTTLIIGKYLFINNALESTSYRSARPFIGILLFLAFTVALNFFLTDEIEDATLGFFFGAIYAGGLLVIDYLPGINGGIGRLILNLLAEGGLAFFFAASVLSLVFKEKKNMGGNVFDRKYALKLLGAGCIPPLLVDLLYAVTGKALPRLLLAGLLLASYLAIAVILQKRSYYESLYRFWILVPLSLLLALAMLSKLPAEAIPDTVLSSAFLQFLSDNPVIGFLTKGLIRCSTGVGNLAETLLNPLLKGRYPDISNILYGLWLFAAARFICSMAVKFKK